VDVVYPPENGALAREVAGAGAVVSQFPMGTPPLPHHFPARNRLIAGLTLGTVVVEAAERSGALITARLAGELGREVYAVPGNVSSEGSHGANGLIRDGARLVEGWADVVAEWPRELREAVRPVIAAGPPSSTVVAEVAAPGASVLLALLGDEPVSIDTLVERSRLTSGQASAELIGLELRGLVRRVAGQRYIRS
jgi:DNA processing protein